MILKPKVRLRTSSGITITSRKNVERYVRRGRARQIDPHLYELIEDSGDYRQVSVAACSARRCYDDGLATQKQLRNTPVVGPLIRIYAGKKLSGPVLADRSTELTVRRLDRYVDSSIIPPWPAQAPVL